MMTPTLLVALLLGSAAADALVPLAVPPVRLQIPPAWAHKVEPGASHRFDSPSEDASFQLDVFKVDGTPMRPAECRDKLVKALGGPGWEKLTVGAAPAARKRYIDPGPKPEKGKKQVEVETHSYVGCNGAVKWALTFTFDVAKRQRFGPLAEKIARSLEYVSPDAQEAQ